MSVIKRDKSTSSKDLVEALEKFAELLSGQGEEDAVEDLRGAAQSLRTSPLGSPAHQKAVGTVIDSFDGDHELNGYIIEKPNPNEWTEADELSLAATRVLSLARRLRA